MNQQKIIDNQKKTITELRELNEQLGKELQQQRKVYTDLVHELESELQLAEKQVNSLRDQLRRVSEEREFALQRIKNLTKDKLP